jgi:hypothetical protein
MNPENPDRGAIVPDAEKAADTMSPAPEQPEDEVFSFDALMIHAWLSQLLDEAIEIYVARRNSKYFGMQNGQAQRGFLATFGHPQDADFHRLAQNMYRFTTCEDPLAVILFRAMDALSAEHDSRNDFASLHAHEGVEPPREALRWMRESMDRWFEWVDAFVHMQTHAQWHLAPECFDADRQKRESAIQALKQKRTEQFLWSRKSSWPTPRADTSAFYRELPIWKILPQPQISEPQRPWPHPELDDAIISLWPLVRRHHWTFTDLLTVLRDLLPDPDSCPAQDERNLATYCLHSLRLRKTVQGRTAKHERPNGYLVALRLVPPVPPSPIFHFGPGPEPEEVQEPKSEA